MTKRESVLMRVDRFFGEEILKRKADELGISVPSYTRALAKNEFFDQKEFTFKERRGKRKNRFKMLDDDDEVLRLFE